MRIGTFASLMLYNKRMFFDHRLSEEEQISRSSECEYLPGDRGVNMTTKTPNY